jgi:dCTP deaminase
MLLKADEIARRLAPGYDKASERLMIRPQPDFAGEEKLGAASVNLRLGCWFGILRRNRLTHLDIVQTIPQAAARVRPLKMHYVPFGQTFVLHPQDFVLAATFEWVRMPSKLAGYVIGRSSWGRRGLIIETAAGVHPGFTGCLTLELSNVGQVPIVLNPGIEICQLFIHRVESDNEIGDKSAFVGQRRPVLGEIKSDRIAQALALDSF